MKCIKNKEIEKKWYLRIENVHTITHAVYLQRKIAKWVHQNT